MANKEKPKFTINNEDSQLNEKDDSYKKLCAKFPTKDIKWRIQSSGKKKNGDVWALALAYVDARAVMDRLDSVFGYGYWYDEYEHLNNGVICKLTVVDPKGRFTVTKQDGSPETAVEAFKGGISKALVRAAVKFGIGRYLYNLEENFVETSKERKEGWKAAKTKDHQYFYWKEPALPFWALCDKEQALVVAREVYNLSKGLEGDELLGFLEEANIKDLKELKDLSVAKLSQLKVDLMENE